MEQDLAENLDDLICAGALNVDDSNYNVWYKIVGLLFVVWIAVAGLVYLGPYHVISSGRQMTNLVSNFEHLLLLCFLTMAEF